MTERGAEVAARRAIRCGEGWRWVNVPIPEIYLAAIGAGVVLHLLRPARLLSRPKVGVVTGIPSLLAGAILAAWAVCAAGEVDTSEPERIVAEGPYAITRNPMYLAWTLIGAGFALLANSVWMLLLLLAAVASTHLIEIPREERDLERKFGARYLSYRARVSRWL